MLFGIFLLVDVTNFLRFINIKIVNFTLTKLCCDEPAGMF